MYEVSIIEIATGHEEKVFIDFRRLTNLLTNLDTKEYALDNVYFLGDCSENAIDKFLKKNSDLEVGTDNV